MEVNDWPNEQMEVMAYKHDQGLLIWLSKVTFLEVVYRFIFSG
jgi:hypothetical protein